MKYSILLCLFLFLSCSHNQLPSPFQIHKEEDSSLVLTAPHCGFDLETEKIVESLSKELKSSFVIACGFRNSETPINVNRPTEWKTEKESQKAKEIYNEFQEKIKGLWPSKGIYIEIHGHHRTDTSLEIAQVGFEKEQWEKVQLLFEEENEEEALGLKLLFEGKDKLAFEAKGSKEKGTLSTFKPALHIEISSDLRKIKLPQIIHYLDQVFSGLTEI